MTQITLTVNNKQVLQSLKAVAQAGPNIVNKNIDDALTQAANKVKKYPSRLSNQKYRRTGTFGRSVKIVKAKRAGGGGSYRRTAKLVTNARRKGRSYSKWVTGDARGQFQAGIHQNRWNVAYEEMQKAAKKIAKLSEQQITKQAQKAGR